MCVLHVNSNTSSFREFLKTTRLPVYRSHEKGDKPFKTKPPYEYYGFSCDASKKDWSDLEGQIQDVVSFQEKHEKELIHLMHTYAIDDMHFDFPYYCRHSKEKLIVQCDYLPPELLFRAGKLNIGIELSLYPKPEMTIMDMILEKIASIKKCFKQGSIK